jgi:hypothetical protein
LASILPPSAAQRLLEIVPMSSDQKSTSSASSPASSMSTSRLAAGTRSPASATATPREGKAPGATEAPDLPRMKAGAAPVLAALVDCGVGCVG